MAQSAQTATAPNPTPPTNLSFTGQTPPTNVPNYTKNTYADTKNWGTGTPTNPPPYFDDGTAGAANVYAAVTSALASGSAATAGGTEGTYPGAGTGSTAYNLPNDGGAVPASANFAHEEVGNVTTVTATVGNPSPAGQLVSVSDGPSLTAAVLPQPNALHASYAIWTAVPTITGSPAPNNIASGTGTVAITLTGTNYNRASVVYIDGIRQETVFVSATSLTVANAPKKPTSGTRSVVVTNGVNGPTSSASTWTFT